MKNFNINQTQDKQYNFYTVAETPQQKLVEHTTPDGQFKYFTLEDKQSLVEHTTPDGQFKYFTLQ